MPKNNTKYIFINNAINDSLIMYYSTKEKQYSELISEKTTLQNNSSFYTKLKYYFNLYFSNFTSLLEKNKVNPPFLPKLDKSKYPVFRIKHFNASYNYKSIISLICFL